jgi:general secretion pathway protein I
LSRSIPPRRGSAGFTLIEALVALAVVATGLSAIGMVVATTVRGIRAIERKLILVETTRAIVAALPDRDQLGLGSLSGQRSEQNWRIDVAPFLAPDLEQQRPTKWLPQAIVLTVRSPEGAVMQINTVRLTQRAGG